MTGLFYLLAAEGSVERYFPSVNPAATDSFNVVGRLRPAWFRASHVIRAVQILAANLKTSTLFLQV
jgi:hypothetical protein